MRRVLQTPTRFRALLTLMVLSLPSTVDAVESYFVRIGDHQFMLPQKLELTFEGKHLPAALSSPGVSAQSVTVYFETDPLKAGAVGRSFLSVASDPQALEKDFLCQASGPVIPPQGEQPRIFKPTPYLGASHVIFPSVHEFFGEPIIVYLDDYQRQTPDTSVVFQTYETRRALADGLSLRVASRTDVLPLNEFPEVLAMVEAAVRSWASNLELQNTVNTKGCIAATEYSE